MKRYFSILLTCVIACQMETVVAQINHTQIDTTIRYYNRLLSSKNPSDRVLVKKYIYSLLASDKEKDWMVAENFFMRISTATTDSVLKAEKEKFPMGIAVRDEQARAIYAETDASKKEILYKNWVRKFPPENFSDDRNQYEYARTSVAVAYAKAANVDKALQYTNMVEEDWYKGTARAETGDELLKNGRLKEALLLFISARDEAWKYLTIYKSDRYASAAGGGFTHDNYAIAEIYYKQHRYKEALPYAKQARDSSQNAIGNENPYYVKTLLALKMNKEALDEIELTMKNGKTTDEIKAALPDLYIKVNGSNAGYDDFTTSINKVLENKNREEFSKRMINIPAPDFVLQDVYGNHVSLASLKGKIVILDFWAIWCVPCKASLPAMQIAVNKYKNDPNVKFLFIHTWENHHRNQNVDDNPTLTAKKYMEDNHYPFQVLMDLKDPSTGKNKVVTSYNVNAIPTKFIIDKEGNIKFRFTGLTYGDDAGAQEVIAMIELARNSE